MHQCMSDFQGFLGGLNMEEKIQNFLVLFQFEHSLYVGNKKHREVI